MVFNGCANVLPCCEELSVGMLKRGSALVAFEEAAVTERHTCTHTNSSGERLLITTCSTILLLMPSSWLSCSEHYRDRFFSCLNIQPQFVFCYTKLWVEIAHPIASVSSAARCVKATTKMVNWHGAAELPFSLSLSLVVRAFPVVVLRFLCFLVAVLEFHTWLIPIVAARDCDCNRQSCWFDSAKGSSACIWSEAKIDECTCWSKSKLIYLCTTMTNDWRTSCLCFLGYASSARMLIIISSLLHLICNQWILLFLVIMWFQISWNAKKLCTVEKNYYHHHIHHQIIRTWTLKELPWASNELPHCQIWQIFNLAQKDCEIECLNCWQTDCEIECQNWYQIFNRCRTNCDTECWNWDGNLPESHFESKMHPQNRSEIFTSLLIS